MFVTPFTDRPFEFDRFLPMCEKSKTGEPLFTRAIMDAAKAMGRERAPTALELKEMPTQIRERAAKSVRVADERRAAGLDVRKTIDHSKLPFPGAERLRPSSVNLDVYAELLKDLKPVALREYCLSLFTDGEGAGSGFGYMPRSLGRGEPREVKMEPDTVMLGGVEKIRADVAESEADGSVTKLFDEKDGWPAWIKDAMCSNNFARAKKDSAKIRRITNYAGAADESGLAVNDLMDAGWCRVELLKMGGVLELLRKMKKRAEMEKRDIARAYRLLVVRACEMCLMMFKCGTEYFVDSRLSFGLRTAPRVFTTFADSITWIAHTYGLSNLVHYLDDFFNAESEASGKGPLAGLVLDALFEVLGIPLSDKSMSGTVGDMLGFILNTESQTIALSPNKLEKIVGRLKEAAERGTATLEDLQSLAGKLGEACEVVRCGRLMLHNFWVVIAEVTEAMVPPQGEVTLSDGLRIDMGWWVQALLATREGRSYVKKAWLGDNLGGVGDTPCSDASKIGIGGHRGNKVWQHKWTEEEKKIMQSSADIHVGEVFGVGVGVFVDALAFAGRSVSFGCDNSSVVMGMEGEKARDVRTQTIMRHISAMAIKGDFHVITSMFSICQGL
jgi:hypothetical protein